MIYNGLLEEAKLLDKNKSIQLLKDLFTKQQLFPNDFTEEVKLQICSEIIDEND